MPAKDHLPSKELCLNKPLKRIRRQLPYLTFISTVVIVYTEDIDMK